MASQKVSHEVNTHLEELPDHSREEYLNMAPYQDVQDHQLLNHLFALESWDVSAAKLLESILNQVLKPRPFEYKQSDLAGIRPSNLKKLRLLSQLAGIPPLALHQH